MATANAIMTAPVAPTVEGVTLTLDFEESLVLNTILRRIAGHPDKSRRGKVDSIERALDKALRGAGVTGLDAEARDVRGYIIFNDTH